MNSLPLENSAEDQNTPERRDGNIEHRISDSVYQNIIQLLWLFESQLSLTAETSQADYDYIMAFCLEQIQSEKIESKQVLRLMKALQYRDRYIQRNDHVIKRLKQLVFHMLREDWVATENELEHEMVLARSWYDDKELESMRKIAQGRCASEKLQIYIDDAQEFVDDIDLFD